jgi:hypothetical protein
LNGFEEKEDDKAFVTPNVTPHQLKVNGFGILSMCQKETVDIQETKEYGIQIEMYRNR